eukprot:6182891-Pleurochrysis_carterae.AAC.3
MTDAWKTKRVELAMSACMPRHVCSCALILAHPALTLYDRISRSTEPECSIHEVMNMPSLFSTWWKQPRCCHAII